MVQGRKSVRAQLLMAAIANAMNAAGRDDYLNAVTNMTAAAGISAFKLPSPPPGMPDIVRGTIWMRWRAFYHNNFPSVFKHVDDVLKSLGGNDLGVSDD
jgi:hypothetical protein